MSGYTSSQYVIDADGNSINTKIAEIPKAYQGLVNPSITDDITKGYLIGSVGINTTDSTVWFCESNTENDAIWIKSNNLQPLKYKGSWNADTNTPTLENGLGSSGDYYVCNVAGTTNFGAGDITFALGDACAYGNGVWENIGSTALISSIGINSAPLSLGGGQWTQVTTAWLYPYNTTEYGVTFSVSNAQNAPINCVHVSHTLTSVTYNVYNPNPFNVTNLVVFLTGTLSGN